MRHHRRINAAMALALMIAALAALTSGPASARINSSVRGTPVPAGAITATAGIAMRSFTVHGPRAQATAGGGEGFHWGDAVVGATVALVAMGLLAPAVSRATRGGKRAHPA